MLKYISKIQTVTYISDVNILINFLNLCNNVKWGLIALLCYCKK